MACRKESWFARVVWRSAEWGRGSKEMGTTVGRFERVGRSPAGGC